MLVVFALAALVASDPVAESPAPTSDNSGALGGAFVGAIVGGIGGTAAAVGAGVVLSRLACAEGCVDDPGGFLIFFAPVYGAGGVLVGAVAGLLLGHMQDAARAEEGSNRPAPAARPTVLRAAAASPSSAETEDDETPSSPRAVVQSIAAQSP